jgi:AraC-like DNA-binding protein
MVNLQSLVLVENELLKLGLRPVGIEMGQAEILQDVTTDQHLKLRIALRQSGLVLLENKQEILVHRIKRTIQEVVYNDNEPMAENLSAFLSARLEYDYTYMSNLFSDAMGITIEKFYICHKVERIKQLLLYEGLTLIEIAQKMHYCSTAHLSSQFKKVAGRTPSQFKQDNRDKHPIPGNCG